ncbi:hypothetical protein MOK15_12760 [Sphingobium sp. BYY-5]|uniref:hypothetical protein n=1 Tax=Sphingobium sp. BYY-5 TaxID=2926400 RepID=UPI001FA75863|nr:hypothetical protein [Sphingobium sp. BYY-5]MCI4590959.1 hypothetical protein [Sphingobium sp. BYY-5]
MTAPSSWEEVLHPVGHAKDEGAADPGFEQRILTPAVDRETVLFVSQVLTPQ